MRDIETLQNIVNAAIDNMTADKNPYFYPMVKTEQGTQRAQQEIVTYAITNNISIGAAIGQLESSYA
jgi:hypothetical protein